MLYYTNAKLVPQDSLPQNGQSPRTICGGMDGPPGLCTAEYLVPLGPSMAP